jgi:hypothetical protein
MYCDTPDARAPRIEREPVVREPAQPPASQPRVDWTVGFIFADSDRRYLTVADLQRLGVDQLRIVRNEIYARKGRYFKDENLRAHFSRFGWYRPYTWDVTLNEVERANVQLIVSTERSRGAPGQNAGDYPARGWTCTASCHNTGPQCTGFLEGAGSGASEAQACLAARKDATHKAPRGCYGRHCQCQCKQ